MKVYKDLIKERAEIRRNQTKINDLELVFDEYDKEPYTEEFWLAIDQILKQLEQKEEDINKEIEELEKDCEHDWQYAGRDSHYSYEECTICGKSEKL